VKDLSSCITSYEDMLTTCDWNCSGSIDGADVLIGTSITSVDQTKGVAIPQEAKRA
jgi:hypothetical protein